MPRCRRTRKSNIQSDTSWSYGRKSKKKTLHRSSNSRMRVKVFRETWRKVSRFQWKMCSFDLLCSTSFINFSRALFLVKTSGFWLTEKLFFIGFQSDHRGKKRPTISFIWYFFMSLPNMAGGCSLRLLAVLLQIFSSFLTVKSSTYNDGESSSPSKPHIIYILADDLVRWDDGRLVK